MDTRKRNVIIGVGVAVLVVVVALVALTVSGGSDKDSDQDKATSSTESAATAASDATSKDAGAMRASGDGTADNQVDASEVFGGSSNAAAGKSADGALDLRRQCPERERLRLWFRFGQPVGRRELG